MEFMKTGFLKRCGWKEMVVVGIAPMVTAFALHADPAKGFIRDVGTNELDAAGSQLEVSRTADGVLSASATWPGGGKVRCKAARPIDTKEWFVYIESPDMIWLFDGAGLRAFMHDNYGCGVGGVSADLFKTCPEEVRAALPESVRK